MPKTVKGGTVAKFQKIEADLKNFAKTKNENFQVS